MRSSASRVPPFAKAGAPPVSLARQPLLPLPLKHGRVSVRLFNRVVAFAKQFAGERDAALTEVRRLTALLDERKPGCRLPAPRTR